MDVLPINMQDPPQHTPPVFIQELKSTRVVYEGYMSAFGPAMNIISSEQSDKIDRLMAGLY